MWFDTCIWRSITPGQRSLIFISETVTNEEFGLDGLGRQAEISKIFSRVEKAINIRKQGLTVLDGDGDYPFIDVNNLISGAILITSATKK